MSDGWSTLKNHDFALVCGARFATTTALQIINVSIGWYIYDVTSSAFALGNLGLAGIIPAFALVLVTGYVTDRIDRRTLMVLASAVFILMSLILLALVAGWPGVVWPLYLIVIVMSSARAFFNPAIQAIVPNLVPNDQLAAAVSFSAGSLQAAQMAGPAIGGILYAIDPRIAFSTSGLLYCGSLLASWLIRYRADVAGNRKQSLRLSTMLAGFDFVWNKKLILGAVSLDMVVVMMGGVVALLPIFAKDILQTGPWGLGLLRASPAIGAITMALWLAHSGYAQRQSGMKLFTSIAIYGAATVAFGFSDVLLVSMLCLMVVGASDMVSVVIRHTMVQAETPDHLRGRVAGVNSLFISCSGELGQLRAGYMAGIFSATTAVVFGGIAAIGLSLLWPRLFPGLRERDHLVDEQPEPARA